ncbi:hypothetical protein [Olivibacter jilunii]|uniref:hypothetical protein n=1 Tax=Olivibacter jilunii TaxID=985016 RepID=UPI003F1851F2
MQTANFLGDILAERRALLLTERIIFSAKVGLCTGMALSEGTELRIRAALHNGWSVIVR